MSHDEQKDRLRGFLSRMADLNAQADALSSEIDAHLQTRRQQTWGDDEDVEAVERAEASENNISATG